MKPRATDRIAIFIDGANFYATAAALGIEVDFRLLLDAFRRRGRLIRAFYYTALSEGDTYSPVRPLADWLAFNGFSVVTKSMRDHFDGTGRKHWRGDMDIELTCDMMEMAKHAHQLYLFSGDGAYVRLVQSVQRLGARVSVVSTRKTNPVFLSDGLRRQADEFIDIADMAAAVARVRASVASPHRSGK